MKVRVKSEEELLKWFKSKGVEPDEYGDYFHGCWFQAEDSILCGEVIDVLGPDKDGDYFNAEHLCYWNPEWFDVIEENTSEQDESDEYYLIKKIHQEIFPDEITPKDHVEALKRIYKKVQAKEWNQE